MRLSRRRSPYLLAAALVLLAACAAPSGAPQPDAAAVSTADAGTEAPPPTESPRPAPTETPAPTAVPTEAQREFRVSQGPAGVFSLNVPADWERLDESSADRLLVRYLPPAGYGSRVTVEVTNEGPQTPEQVRALAESFVRLHYGTDPAYEALSREETQDGALVFTFAYDDGLGAAGQETLTTRQVGPYFAALRVLLADADEHRLGQALDAVAASFRVDALAQWSSSIAAVNPAALSIDNAALWRSEDDVWGTVYSGEVRNAAESPVTDVEVRVVLCDARGVVMGEFSGQAGLEIVEPGAAAPFALHLGDVAAGLEVCSVSASAVPAPPASPHTTALQVQADAGLEGRERFVVQGQVTNPGLAAVGDVRVLMAAYNEEGQLIGFETTPLGADVVLQPGASAPFSHTFTALGGEASRLQAQAQGRTLDERNPSLAARPDEG